MSSVTTFNADDDAATRIQQQWRCGIARRAVSHRRETRQRSADERRRRADELEAALLIQTRFRILLARARTDLQRKRRAAEAAELGTSPCLSSVVVPVTAHIHPKALPERLFEDLSAPPDDEAVSELFEAMDPHRTGSVPRAHARWVFDRLTHGLVSGDPEQHFSRLFHSNTNTVSYDEFFLVVLRAASL